jgi:uncharacterized protein YeaO (DUF488 family)
MPIRTKRWNDVVAPDDGFRLLVCRLRPRGLAKANETWDAWWPDLGPSRALLDAFHGKAPKGSPPVAALPWPQYVPRYLAEMQGPGQLWRIRDLARRVAEGETITLLCASTCTEPARCHRTLLANLIAPGGTARAGQR